MDNNNLVAGEGDSFELYIVEGFAYIKSFFEGSFFDNNIFYFLFIILVTYILAFIVKFIFDSILKKAFSKTKTDLDDVLISELEKPVFKTIVLFGFIFAGFIFLHDYFFWGAVFKLAITFLVLVWLFSVINIVKIVLRFFSKFKKSFVKKQTLPLFENMTYVLILVFGLYLALKSIWGVDMTAIIASLGVAGIAIGFAAKDTLANLISGVFILTDQPYKIGDYVLLDSGERGQVRHIGIRSTRILTRGDVELIIPNAVMGGAKITNQSGGPNKNMRLELAVGVAYGSDIDIVEKILLAIAKSEEVVLKTPNPRVRFRNLGASSLDFGLLFWIKDPEEKGRAIDSMYRKVYKEFNKNDIEIPYAKQDLYIKEIPSA